MNGAEGGKVPLVVAARHGDGAMAAWLLEKKARMQMTDSDGWSADNHAASRGHEELAQRPQGGQNGQGSGAGVSAQDLEHPGPATMLPTTTATVTRSVVTTRPGYTALGLGGAVTASTLSRMSESSMANDPEVQGLAEQAMRGSLELREEQNEGTTKALAALLAIPQCKVKQLYLKSSTKIEDAHAALLTEALKVNRTLDWLSLHCKKINEQTLAAIESALESNRTCKR